MKWANLRKKECPYCSAALKQNEDTLEMACTACYFTISFARFRDMIAGAPQQIKWSNLKSGRCAYTDCGAMLRETELNTRLVRCSSPGCTFKIGEERLQTILSDKTHAANATREESQGFERHEYDGKH